MRKFIRTMPVLLVLVACLASCLKVEEKDYSYSKTLYTDADSLRATQIMDIIRTRPYFTTGSTYFGTYTDTYAKAQNEFVTEVQALDDSLIVSHLEAGEYATLCLISDTSGELCAYRSWTPESDQ